jgi:hypothetical protein
MRARKYRSIIGADKPTRADGGVPLGIIAAFAATVLLWPVLRPVAWVIRKERRKDKGWHREDLLRHSANWSYRP